MSYHSAIDLFIVNTQVEDKSLFYVESFPL